MNIHPKQTPQEKAKAARRMAALRWEGTTAEERSEAMRLVQARREYGPANPAQARCPCGRMTFTRASARADKNGKGLGHAPDCSFYRRQRHGGKRKNRID